MGLCNGGHKQCPWLLRCIASVFDSLMTPLTLDAPMTTTTETASHGAQPLTTAPALAVFPALDGGVLPASPAPEIYFYGINQAGELYRYGETAARPGPVAPAICGLPYDIKVVTMGAGSKFGPREYLELRMVAPQPGAQCWLRLPCWRANPQGDTKPFPIAARSLLSALLTVDVSATAVKLEAKKGSKGGTFIQVSLDPEGLQRIKADLIGPDRLDLEAAVDRLRVTLGLSPQFP